MPFGCGDRVRDQPPIFVTNQYRNGDIPEWAIPYDQDECNFDILEVGDHFSQRCFKASQRKSRRHDAALKYGRVFGRAYRARSASRPARSAFCFNAASGEALLVSREALVDIPKRAFVACIDEEPVEKIQKLISCCPCVCHPLCRSWRLSIFSTTT